MSGQSTLSCGRRYAICMGGWILTRSLFRNKKLQTLILPLINALIGSLYGLYICSRTDGPQNSEPTPDEWRYYTLLTSYFLLDLIINRATLTNDIILHHMMSLYHFVYVQVTGSYSLLMTKYITALETSSIFLNLRYILSDPMFSSYKHFYPAINVLFAVTFIIGRLIIAPHLLFSEPLSSYPFSHLVAAIPFHLLNFYWGYLIIRTIGKKMYRAIASH